MIPKAPVNAPARHVFVFAEQRNNLDAMFTAFEPLTPLLAEFRSDPRINTWGGGRGSLISEKRPGRKAPARGG